MGQITIMKGPERRRRWRDEERFQILAEAFAPGACVADVAPRWDVSNSLIYTWRGNLRREQAEGASLPMAETAFAQAVLAEEQKSAGCDRCGVITVELGEAGSFAFRPRRPLHWSPRP